MIDWLKKKLFGHKGYVTPPFWPYKKRHRLGMSRAARRLYGYKFPVIRIKELVPPFPGGTWVYPDSWYDAWNKNLKDQGWTKKELKQGWRWKKYETNK